MADGTELEQAQFDKAVEDTHSVVDFLNMEWGGIGKPSEEDVRFVLEAQRDRLRKMLPGAAVEIGGVSTRKDESGKLVIYVQVGEYREGEDSTS